MAGTKAVRWPHCLGLEIEHWEHGTVELIQRQTAGAYGGLSMTASHQRTCLAVACSVMAFLAASHAVTRAEGDSPCFRQFLRLLETGVGSPVLCFLHELLSVRSASSKGAVWLPLVTGMARPVWDHPRLRLAGFSSIRPFQHFAQRPAEAVTASACLSCFEEEMNVSSGSREEWSGTGFRT